MLDLDKLKSDVLIIEELLAKVTRLIDNLESNEYDILDNENLLTDLENKYVMWVFVEQKQYYRNNIKRLEENNLIIQNEIEETWDKIEEMIMKIILSVPDEIETEINYYKDILSKLENDSKRFSNIKSKSMRIDQIKQYINKLEIKLETLKGLNYKPQEYVYVLESIVGKLYYLFVYDSKISKDTKYESKVEKEVDIHFKRVLYHIYEAKRRYNYINIYDIFYNPIKDINVAIAIKNKLIDLNVLTKDGTLWESSLTIIRKMLDCNKTYGVKARTSEQTKD